MRYEKIFKVNNIFLLRLFALEQLEVDRLKNNFLRVYYGLIEYNEPAIHT